jgi:Resolvase, N terminal domain
MADLCIAYYRVSTQRTGPSLEVQQRAVRDHLDGGGWTLLAELIEIESAKRADRPGRSAHTLPRPRREAHHRQARSPCPQRGVRFELDEVRCRV